VLSYFTKQKMKNKFYFEDKMSQERRIRRNFAIVALLLSFTNAITSPKDLQSVASPP